jgi:UDP-N-acetyl-D-mannosaminuronate dehydrogenase
VRVIVERIFFLMFLAGGGYGLYLTGVDFRDRQVKEINERRTACQEIEIDDLFSKVVCKDGEKEVTFYMYGSHYGRVGGIQ